MKTHLRHLLVLLTLAGTALHATPALALNPPETVCPGGGGGGGGGEEDPPDTDPPETKGPEEADNKDPINLINGSVWRKATDIAIPCPGFDLTLVRTYCNTRGTVTNAPFGKGWTHSLDPRLYVMSPAEMYLDSGDGHVTDLAVGIPQDPPLEAYDSCTCCHGGAMTRPVATKASRGPQRKLDSDLRVVSLGADGWRVTAPGFRHMDFSSDGLARRFWNAAGQSVDFLRDTSGRLTNVTHSGGQSIVFEYEGEDPRVRRASVPGQQLAVEYEYPSEGGHYASLSAAVRETSSGAASQSYEYEGGSGYMTRCDTPSGLSFHYSYTTNSVDGEDLKKRVAAATWAEPGDLYKGTVTYGPAVMLVSGSGTNVDWRFSWEWSSINTLRDGQSFETRYKKDPATDRTLEISHPCGETDFFDYDPETRQLSGERRRGKLYPMGGMHVAGDTFETVYGRDAENRVTSVRSAFYTAHVSNPDFVSPAGQAPAWEVAYDDACRQPAVFTDPCGRAAYTDFGEHGLPLTNRTDLATGFTIAESFSYTTNGLLAAHRDPCGRATSYAYGPGGYLAEVTPPAGPAASFSWNAALGIMTNVTLPGPGGAPRVYALEKDELGRTLRAVYPGGLSETFLYDAAGRVTNSTDAAGRVTRHAWHPGGKLAEVVSDADGLAASVSFDYSQQMETLSITDPLGREVERYALDGLGRATAVWDIEGRAMTVSYLLGGMVSDLTRFDGTPVSFAYDSAARVSRAEYQDDTLEFAYLACGRPAAASNSVSALLWSYDAAGRLTNETAQTTTLASRVSHSLDLSGLATNTALSVESWALNAERSFDPAGRLDCVSQVSSFELPVSNRFSFSYCDWSGLVSSVSNAALTAEYASDILDRVTNITYRTAGGGVMQSFSYAYDLSGLITQQVSVAQASAPVTNSYAYDGLGRLVSERIQNSGTLELSNFSYDLAGNRLSVSSAVSVVNNTYTHNRLTAASDGTVLAYDAAGCVTNMLRDGVTLAFAWNGQRQLVSVSTNGAFAEAYAYDALGRRVSTTDSGGTVFHVYDGDECVADLDADGNPLRSYLWGQGIDNLLAVTVFSTGSTNTYYAVKDHLGSVHALVDASGSVVESYTYDAWGNVQSAVGNGQSATGNRYLFQGREYSFATGLYNFRARWYDPEIGRWLSNDPIGISGGLNLYEFCGNNPVNYKDPWGEAWYDKWHFEGRDARNKNLPKNPGEARDSGFIRQPASMNKFHDNKTGKPEVKYVHPDGREAVYDGDTCELVADPKLKGTYNYVNPAPWSWNPLKWNTIIIRGTGHAVLDMAPYAIGGNVRGEG